MYNFNVFCLKMIFFITIERMIHNIHYFLKDSASLKIPLKQKLQIALNFHLVVEEPIGTYYSH